MDQERQHSQPEDTSYNQEPIVKPPSETREPTPLRTRVIAALGALLTVILTILYAYSIATGKIFAW